LVLARRQRRPAPGSSWAATTSKPKAFVSATPKNAWLIDTNGRALNLGPLLNPSHNPG